MFLDVLDRVFLKEVDIQQDVTIIMTKILQENVKEKILDFDFIKIVEIDLFLTNVPDVLFLEGEIRNENLPN